MQLQLIRHATLQLVIAGQRILVDPMFSSAGEMEAAPNTANPMRNPLAELPYGVPGADQWDAVIVTHTHRDHFDAAAAQLLPKHVALFCQLEDCQKFKDLGFEHVIQVEDHVTWNGIRIYRTRGRHGRGEMERKMGPVSGFVLTAEREPVIYLTGDMVWCSEVEEVIERFHPDVTVVFAGAAQFLDGGLITMGIDDIERLCRGNSTTKVVAAHMEAWNHCLLTRRELREYAELHDFSHRVMIPQDGEWMKFEASYVK